MQTTIVTVGVRKREQVTSKKPKLSFTADLEQRRRLVKAEVKLICEICGV